LESRKKAQGTRHKVQGRSKIEGRERRKAKVEEEIIVSYAPTLY
jgi:hypothetical protein